MPTTKSPKKELSFIEVERSEVPERGPQTAAARALLDGKTIWIEGTGHANRYAGMAKTRGYRIRSRTAEREGVMGTYLWVEPKGA